jgi:5-methylcytosine-specific restriction endonuclease McrA
MDVKIILGVKSKTCKNCGNNFIGSKCKECHKLAVLKYRKNNADKVKQYRKQYREKNKKIIAEKMIVYRAKNSINIQEKAKQWALQNKDKRLAHQHNRRANKIKSGGKLSDDLIEKLFNLQRGKCACCGDGLGENFHLDHIMPLALGGSNTDGNMQLLKQRCNNQKHSKHPIDYMQSKGFLI